jgi:hypothetical protein
MLLIGVDTDKFQVSWFFIGSTLSLRDASACESEPISSCAAEHSSIPGEDYGRQVTPTSQLVMLYSQRFCKSFFRQFQIL